ncbi:MAG: BMC domain-containing protein [Clostridiales bacterium]|jgi:microcompartment protein CcmL/EutN|nr:BMC domain-containing protein [Clostridiales bacterium]
MGNAYGFIEITGIVAALDAIDIMCKASSVGFVTWEKKLGGRLVTIVIQGSVSDVSSAIEAVKSNGIKKPVASGVLASPHEEIVYLVNESARKFTKQGGIKF